MHSRPSASSSEDAHSRLSTDSLLGLTQSPSPSPSPQLRRHMPTFHPFPRLPIELRAHIWRLSVVARDVDVRFKREHGGRGLAIHIVSSTPAPAVMQACSESRNLGLYQPSFVRADERYLWINFEVDRICIPDIDFEVILPEQQLIRRLKYEGEMSEEYGYSFHDELPGFRNLQEIHLLCADGLWSWRDEWEDLYWPCPRESIRATDKASGRTTTGTEADILFGEDCHMSTGIENWIGFGMNFEQWLCSDMTVAEWLS
ncbi:hypothetical protein B0I35DRAFT_437656 [Stachybotrys elegans]|uniref:2EXR domain-containing protein n=1 Tax=Stachybotrys elegans TaxID=80388 RepID=A0A8K0SI74_9HYPO|nr:hypothetical protein B0I35DRAFT_437656 [Stachybotrys elegans]